MSVSVKRIGIIVAVVAMTTVLSVVVLRWLDRMNPDRECRSDHDCWIAN